MPAAAVAAAALHTCTISTATIPQATAVPARHSVQLYSPVDVLVHAVVVLPVVNERQDEPDAMTGGRVNHIVQRLQAIEAAHNSINSSITSQVNINVDAGDAGTSSVVMEAESIT
jgi:hypothetical protein